MANALFLHAKRGNLTLVPLLLHEREARMLEYFRREHVRLSGVLENVLRHGFANAGPLCATLALWACDACNGRSEEMMAIAAAAECLYRFALLHDELHALPVPARGESTATVWGLAQTLNAGDAYHGLALKFLAAPAADPERTLRVAIVLEESVLRGIEQRACLLRMSSTRRGRPRLRAAYGGTRAQVLSAAMRAGALMSSAPEPAGSALARAGTALAVAIQLASSGRERGTSPLARTYADSALSHVRRAGVASTYIDEFEEIAHELSTGY